MIKIVEKRPGPDWIVTVLLIEEGEEYPVTVFGAADEAEAIRDAVASFSNLSRDQMKIISVIRD